MLVWTNAGVMLKNVTFRNMALAGAGGPPAAIKATTVGVYPGGGVLLHVRAPPPVLLCLHLCNPD